MAGDLAKSATTLGAKGTPVYYDRGGSWVDAAWELENLKRVDPVAAADEPRTPAFRNPRTGRSFTDGDIHNWVQQLAARIGEDEGDFGAHSLRIGGATAMFALGADPTDIRTVGRWCSDLYVLYTRAVVGRSAKWAARIGSADYETVQDEFEEVDFY